MIHFDWDILGVNLETFSPEMIPLQPCLGETPITPEQVELFTSLLQQEVAAMETSSFKPTFPQSIILSEKPQHVRQMPENAQAESAQDSVNTPYITVKASVYPPVQTTAPLEVLDNLAPLENLEHLETPAMAPAMENAKSSVKEPSTQMPVLQDSVNTLNITVKAFVYAPLQPMASLENLESLESLEVLENLDRKSVV